MQNEFFTLRNFVISIAIALVAGFGITTLAGYSYVQRTIGDSEYRVAEYSRSNRELSEQSKRLDVENKRLGETKAGLEQRQIRLLTGISGIGDSIDQLSSASKALSGQGTNIAGELRRIAYLIKDIANKIGVIRSDQLYNFASNNSGNSSSGN